MGTLDQKNGKLCLEKEALLIREMDTLDQDKQAHLTRKWVTLDRVSH